MENLLSIRDLKINFNLGSRTITAVDKLDLDIHSQEVLVLAGESGSGKTVTALAITKLLPKKTQIISGSINFRGQDLLLLDEPALSKIRGRHISYIFQEPTSFLNPVYTVAGQIMEVIRLHQNKEGNAAWEEAQNLLTLVKIQEPGRVLLNYPHQLSGGMNQRVFIAMALASRPKILIADEPTTSLDVTIESEILDLLMDLKTRLGFSLLFITHNLSIARRIADRIAIMYNGKIVEAGNRQTIFNSPQHFHTKALINAYEKIGRIL